MKNSLAFILMQFLCSHFAFNLQANDGQAEWKKLYEFRSHYGLDTMHPSDLHALLTEFREADSAQFAKYYNALYVDTEAEDSRVCGCHCKASHLCAIAFVDYDDFEECYEKASTSECDDTSGVGRVGGMSGMWMASLILAKMWFV